MWERGDQLHGARPLQRILHHYRSIPGLPGITGTVVSCVGTIAGVIYRVLRALLEGRLMVPLKMRLVLLVLRFWVLQLGTLMVVFMIGLVHLNYCDNAG